MKRLVESLEAGVVDATGAPLAYGKVFSYEAGTTTLQTLFQDFELETPHANPLTLDGAGRAVAYADGRIKLVVQNAAGTLVRTVDNVGTEDSDLTASSNTGLAGNGLVTAADGALDVNVDTTLTISSNQIGISEGGVSTSKLLDGSVTTAKIADGNVTPAKKAALGQQVSSSSAGFLTSSGTYVDVTNLTVTITTTGRPVFIGMMGDGTDNTYMWSSTPGTSTQHGMSVRILRGATQINCASLGLAGQGTGITNVIRSGACPWIIDPVAAGTYTYKVQAKAWNTAETGSAYVGYYKLVAYEL